MASCVLKIFERIINDRLMWWVEANKMIPDVFCGFRTGKSCYDNLANLRLDLEIARVQGMHTGVIFTDIEGAYDNVNITNLCQKLIDLQIPPKITKFIHNSFSNRDLSGFCGGVGLGERNTNKGLPQGSILSPLLFNLYILNSTKNLDSRIHFSSFADDLRINTSHASLNDVLAVLTYYLVTLEDRLNSDCPSISFDKTKLMLFGSGKTSFKQSSKSIRIQHKIITKVNQAKYLGVTWDTDLNWEAHLKQVKVEAGKLLNILNSIANFKWGAHPSSVISIYKTLIRPGLEWAGFLFNNSSIVKIQKLNVIQNAALRKGLGCIRTTPINILHRLSGCFTLQDRLDELT